MSCHVSPTGAGKRNGIGGTIFERDLSLQKTRNWLPEEFSGNISSFFSVGSEIRTQNRTNLGTSNSNTTMIPQGSLYFEARGGKHITLYVDQDLANTRNREAYGMIHNLPLDGYIRAGRMNLPYGLRIADDTSFIRTNLNLTFAQQDIGLESGFFPKPFEMNLAISNGAPGSPTDENDAKALTTSASWVGEYGRAGLSFQWNRRLNNQFTTGGLHTGWHFWRLIWLGEIDLQQSNGNNLLAGYSELNWQVVEGLYLKTIYDFLDPDYKTPNNLQHRLGGGVDFYPVPLTKLMLLYRNGIGQGAAGDDQILAELHFFF